MKRWIPKPYVTILVYPKVITTPTLNILGSFVLSYAANKQTNRQTDRQTNKQTNSVVYVLPMHADTTVVLTDSCSCEYRIHNAAWQSPRVFVIIPPPRPVGEAWFSIERIGVIYGGIPVPPLVGLRGTVPRLFRMKRWRICCHMLSTEVKV